MPCRPSLARASLEIPELAFAVRASTCRPVRYSSPSPAARIKVLSPTSILVAIPHAIALPACASAKLFSAGADHIPRAVKNTFAAVLIASARVAGAISGLDGLGWSGIHQL
jgi:hypothetical protein